jgi:hypothetical protein
MELHDTNPDTASCQAKPAYQTSPEKNSRKSRPKTSRKHIGHGLRVKRSKKDAISLTFSTPETPMHRPGEARLARLS